MRKIEFKDSEQEQIVKEYVDGNTLTAIAEDFSCSVKPVRKILINVLGEKYYHEIAREHWFENGKKNGTNSVYQFSPKEKNLIVEKFKDGNSYKEFGKEFKCSWSPIKKVLIERLGEMEYFRIAKEHIREGEKKGIIAAAKKPPTRKKIKSNYENGKNAGELPKVPSQIAATRRMGEKYGPINILKAHEANDKNHNFVSKPEAMFYITILSRTFFLKDIVPQFHIKDLNHRVDFAVPRNHLFFEIDGDYYHSLPGKKERDVEINEWSQNNSWIMLRYHDSDLKKLNVI